MAEVKIKMTGALVNETGDITVENISTEETLEKVLKAAETINNTLKTNTTSVNTAQLNSRFGKLSETTSNLNKSFSSLSNSVSDISKKLGNIDVSDVAGSVDQIRETLDQTAADIGGFGGNLWDIAGSANQASQALNLFEDSSANMSASASEAGAMVAGLSKKAALALVALDLLASAVGGIARMLGGLFSSAVKLISQFVMGENKLSAYTETVAEALASIPLLGGLLGGLVGVVAAAIKTVEGYRDVQAQLAESGAAFGQDLMYIRDLAEKTGLGMEGFAAAISKNTEIFAKFGSVTQGAVLFAKTTAILRDRLRDMGYTVEDINEGLAQAMSLNSAGAAIRNQSDQALADTAQRLMTEMDAMAKLTGQSRRSQSEAIRKQQMTAAYQMALAKMDSTSREMVNQEMMQMQAVMGDIGAEMVKLRVLGLQPFTNEQIMATTTMGRAVSILNNTTDLALKGKLNQEKLDEKTADILEAAGDDALRVKDILRVAAAGFGGSAADISKNFDELYTRMGQFVDNTGKLDRKRFIESLKTIREEQKKRDLAAQSLNKFENSMMKLRTVLIDKVLTPLYNIFAPMLMEFANNFEKRLPEFYQGIENFGKGTVEVLKSIAEWTLKLTNMTWWETMIDDIGIKFQEMILDIRGSLPRHMGGLYADEVKAHKQMLRDRKEQNKAIREVEDERARASVEGRPVNLSEKQIQDAYQAIYAKKQTEILESVGDELKKLGSQQQSISELEQTLQRRSKIRERRTIDGKLETEASQRARITASKADEAGDKPYLDSLKKLKRLRDDQISDLKKRLNISEKVALTISDNDTKFYESLKPLIEEKIGTYKKFKTEKKTASPIPGLDGLADVSRRMNFRDSTPVTTEYLKSQNIPIANTGRVHEEGEKLSNDLLSKLPQISKAIAEADIGLKVQHITALNDNYHKNLKDNSGAAIFSKHQIGQAVDFTLSSSPTPDQAKKIETVLKNLGFVNIINEYDPTKQSGSTTGGHIHAEVSRAKGTLGATGKLFENFGTGTQITTHNLESIMTPTQLRDIITVSQKKLTNEVIDEIRRNDKESITDSQNKILNDVAMVGKQITLNNEAQNRMVNLLTQIREILGDSHRYHREIASNI